MDKLDAINRKASWVVALAAALLIGYQQLELRRARHNEGAADAKLIKLQLETRHQKASEP